MRSSDSRACVLTNENVSIMTIASFPINKKAPWCCKAGGQCGFALGWKIRFRCLMLRPIETNPSTDFKYICSRKQASAGSLVIGLTLPSTMIVNLGFPPNLFWKSSDWIDIAFYYDSKFMLPAKALQVHALGDPRLRITSDLYMEVALPIRSRAMRHGGIFPSVPCMGRGT